MSQNTDLSTVNDNTSADVFDNSNDHCKSTSDVTVVNNNNNNGWANFDTFENDTNHNSECIIVTDSNDADDDWADFQSNTEHSVAISGDKPTGNEDHDLDEMQLSSTSVLSTNSFNTDQIEKLISSCFPLQSPTLSADTDSSISFQLPTFTTFKDPLKQLPSLQPCLCLWSALSHIPNDPIGVQYQWRKSNAERLFHRTVASHNKLQKNTPLSTNPFFEDCDPSDLDDLPSNPFYSSEIDDNLFDVNTTVDVEYYIPSKPMSLSTTEQTVTSTPIKTTDLFPGSTTVLNDEPKLVVNPSSNFSFMNPKALMSATQITPESTI